MQTTRTAPRPPFPRPALLALWGVLLLGAIATIVAGADAVGSLVPPEQRVTIAGHASVPWAARTYALAWWPCSPYNFTHPPCAPAVATALATVNRALLTGLIATAALALLAVFAGGLASAGPRRPPRPARGVFTLRIGRSRGILGPLGHGAAVARGADCILPGPSAAQNVMGLGGIGSGKTSALLNDLARQALRQNCGFLAFDVKGNYGRTLAAIAASVGRPLERIGLGGRRMNLLKDLTPETAASFLKSALLLQGLGRGTGAVYVNVAAEYAKNLFGVLSFTDDYSLAHAYTAVFEEMALMEAITAAQANVPHSDPRRPYLDPYVTFLTSVFPDYEQRIKTSVKQSLSAVLDAFQHPEIKNAFCTDDVDAVSMTELLDGKAFILDLPLAIYGVSAKTVYTMVKLRFFNVMQRREVEPTWNQSRYVVMQADEYQEIVSVAPDALSDLTFWDKSRSAKTVGIISAQGISSLEASIGNRETTRAMLQNFRQKLCFVTEDLTTIDYFVDLVGDAEVVRDTSTRSRSSESTFGLVRRGLNRQSRTSREPVLGAQLWRTELDRGHALALLQIDGKSYDDVLEMPYYEPTPVAT